MRISGHILLALLITSCSFTQKIKSGEQAYDLKRYDLAVTLLLDEYEGTGERAKARKAYLLGKSFSVLKEDKEAAQWFSLAARGGYGPEARLELAKSLRKIEKYEEALALLMDMQVALPTEPAITRQIAIVKQAIQWAKRPAPDVEVQRMPFNSDRADYGGAFIDDDYLVFTSDRDEATGSAIYDWTGNHYSDMFVVHRDANRPLPYDGLLNSQENDGTPTLTQDRNEMYFTRCYSDDPAAKEYPCRIMYTYKQEGLWVEPEVVPFWDGTVSYGQPCLIENDNVLVFVAQLEEGNGGYDLYYSVYDQGQWTEPYTMPATINTEGDEYFPTSDGDTLYFSSDYLTGMGGLDIFKTYLRKDGSWAPPQNLLPPINSGADDFHYLIDRQAPLAGRVEASGYLTSTRNGGTDDDIYRWRKYQPVQDTNVIAAEPSDSLERTVEIYLAGVAVTDQFAVAGDPNSEKVGTQPVPYTYIKLDDNEGFTTDQNGRFLTRIDIDQVYSLRASKQGYLNNIVAIDSRSLNIAADQNTYTINVTIPLDKIFTGVEIVLDNIYYDFNRWEIRKDARPVLDQLVTVLKNNPQIDIELGSHTDCRGLADYNQELSQKRAGSALAYISDQGIARSRLTARGYGEEKPTVSCVCLSCTEEEHQKNRRTTFRILE